jgi:hypothetical protein
MLTVFFFGNQEESTTRGPILKIWDLSEQSTTKSSNDPSPPPTLLRSVKLTQQLSSLKPYLVSCIALSLNLAHLSIGFADGTVLLYRHLDQSLASSSSLTSLPKLRVVHEPLPATTTISSSSPSSRGNGTATTVSGNEPITGLGFKEPAEDSPNVHLFVITTGQVLSYQVSGKGSGAPATFVDEIGCGLGCARIDWKARQVVVTRDEAIYLCGTDGRGACYAYEGIYAPFPSRFNQLKTMS